MTDGTGRARARGRRIGRWLLGLALAGAVLFVAVNFGTLRAKFSGRQEFTDVAAFARCVNARTWTPFRLPKTTQKVDGASVKGDDAALLWNVLGWHVRWMILLDRRATPPVAYEVPMTGMFAVDVPTAIVKAVPKCGIEFRSSLPDDARKLVYPVFGDGERIAF